MPLTGFWPLGCCHGRWLCPLLINALGRVLRIIIHLLWGLWDGFVHTLLKSALVLVWPRGAIKWDFWRIIFCTIWLEKCTKNGVVTVEFDTASLGPLNRAAEVFRRRIFEELQMFSIVSVLLAGMTFAPLVTPFDDTIMTGPLMDCFTVCCYLAMVLSVLLTGLYARLATTLRYCPNGKYIIWFIYRFEPTFALMHITFMCTIHLVIIAASAALWNNWRCQLKVDGETSKLRPLLLAEVSDTGVKYGECSRSNMALYALYVTVGACVIYFLYVWSNSMFCHHNGLSGILYKTGKDEHIPKFMRHFKKVLEEEPFKVYGKKEPTQKRNEHKEYLTATTLDFCNERPCPSTCDNCFCEPGVAVVLPECCCEEDNAWTKVTQKLWRNDLQIGKCVICNEPPHWQTMVTSANPPIDC